MGVMVREKKTISFTYKKLDGTWREVKNFNVDNVFVSKKGHRIIQGWREDGSGHSYRRNRMSNVKEIIPKAERKTATRRKATANA